MQHTTMSDIFVVHINGEVIKNGFEFFPELRPFVPNKSKVIKHISYIFARVQAMLVTQGHRWKVYFCHRLKPIKHKLVAKAAD